MTWMDLNPNQSKDRRIKRLRGNRIKQQDANLEVSNETQRKAIK